MQFISEQDQQRIRDAIAEVESKTSGELVTVIAHSSDNYQYIPLLWASLLALALPGPFVFAEVDWFLAHWYTYQLACFLITALVFRIPAIRLRLIPAAVRQRRAHRHAMEQFVINNLSATKQANGILLFVSIAEHYVEIIADKGINDKVPANTWETVVESFTGQVRKGAIAEGFIEAIHACGHVLHTHFPADRENPDELPNHLIVV